MPCVWTHSSRIAEYHSTLDASLDHAAARLRARDRCTARSPAAADAADTETPVATPSVTIARAMPIAADRHGPLEMTYRFVVAPNAPAFTEDYWVFVHFLDADGELMWTDDHQPPVPTTQWKPGQTIEYTRTMFVPKFPYVGRDARRGRPLLAEDRRARADDRADEGAARVRVATFNLHPQTDNLYVVFKDGWHETEVGEGAPASSGSGRRRCDAWRSATRCATCVFYLQCDQPVQGLGEPQRVELRIGPMRHRQLCASAGRQELRKIELSKAQLGDGETVEVTVAVDKTFVPATIAQLKSTDPRELGIRVFRAYVQAE